MVVQGLQEAVGAAKGVHGVDGTRDHADVLRRVLQQSAGGLIGGKTVIIADAGHVLILAGAVDAHERDMGMRLQRCDKVAVTADIDDARDLLGQHTRPMIGMHFFNPADRMKLVEVIAGVNTPAETVDAIKKIAEEIGKTPVQVNEAAGFVVNRILVPMINEAAFIKMEGVSDIAGIDAAMKLGANHPMGPLELGDFIGLDICLAIMDVLYAETGDSKYRACPLIRKMVRGGNLGAKSGKGFYVYNADRTKTPVDAQ